MDNFLHDSAGTRQELDTNMAVSSVDSQKDNQQLNTSTSSSQPRTTITASVTAILHSAANLMQSSAGTLLGLRTRSSDASAHEEVVVQGSSKSDAQLTNKRSRSTTSEKK